MRKVRNELYAYGWVRFNSSLREQIYVKLHYKNTPIQIYWKLYNPKMKISR